MDKKIVNSIPEDPGIYIFKNGEKVIYVGKAINLKRRVRSYFESNLLIKTRRMVSDATDLEYIVVGSDFEALLLEAKLIKKYQPKYNVIAKDDKHPLYILVTDEKFPRVISARKASSEGIKIKSIFGPFPSSRNVHSVLRMIRRIFPFSDHKVGTRKCIYAHIGLCDPCPNVIKNEEDRKIYLKNIRRITSLLSGNLTSVKDELEKEMDSLSKINDFESAAKVRDKIEIFDYITKKHASPDDYLENPNLREDLKQTELKALESLIAIKNLKRIECFDIAHLAGSMATASMVTFIDGEPDKRYYRHFRLKEAKGGDDYSSMSEISKRRKKNFQTWGRPDLIIVDGGKGQVSSFSKEIKDIPIVGIAKHPDRLIVNDLKIKLEGDAFNLIARMRDEAHRFARVYHHKLVSKNMLK